MTHEQNDKPTTDRQMCELVAEVTGISEKTVGRIVEEWNAYSFITCQIETWRHSKYWYQ